MSLTFEQRQVIRQAVSESRKRATGRRRCCTRCGNPDRGVYTAGCEECAARKQHAARLRRMRGA